jgi:hypothetical protein
MYNKNSSFLKHYGFLENSFVKQYINLSNALIMFNNKFFIKPELLLELASI